MYMQRNVLKQSGDSKMVVCVDRIVNGDYWGRLYNHVDKREIVFHGFPELVYQIEEILTRIKFPSPAHAYHSFQVDENTEETGERFYLPGDMLVEEMAPGLLASFVVLVQFRHNATWAGLLFCEGKDRPRHFQSVLELIRLIDENPGCALLQASE